MSVILEEARLVTGHEFGHNWGSHHDPGDVSECREIFIMNEFAQDGSEETHRVCVCVCVCVYCHLI